MLLRRLQLKRSDPVGSTRGSSGFPIRDNAGGARPRIGEEREFLRGTNGSAPTPFGPDGSRVSGVAVDARPPHASARIIAAASRLGVSHARSRGIALC